MAPRNLLDIPLVGGLETKMDPRVVPPGKFIELDNFNFDSPGSLVKRDGFKAYKLTSLFGEAISSPKGILSLGESLVFHGAADTRKGKSFTYISQEVDPAGELIAVPLASAPSSRIEYVTTSLPTSLIVNGQVSKYTPAGTDPIYAITRFSDVCKTQFFTEDGTYLGRNTVTGVTNYQTVVLGDKLYAIHKVLTGGDANKLTLTEITYSNSAETTAPNTTAITGAIAIGDRRFWARELNGDVYVVCNASGSGTLFLGKITTTSHASNAFAWTNTSAATDFAHATFNSSFNDLAFSEGTTDHIFLVYFSSASLVKYKFFLASDGTSTAFEGTILDLTGVAVPNAVGCVYTGRTDGEVDVIVADRTSGSEAMRHFKVTTAGSAEYSTKVFGLEIARPVSRPFYDSATDNTYYLAAFIVSGNIQSVLALVKFNQTNTYPEIAGQALRDRVTGFTRVTDFSTPVVLQENGFWTAIALRAEREIKTGVITTSATYSLQLMKITLDTPLPHTKIGSKALFGGAVLREIDKKGCAPLAFWHFPPNIVGGSAGAGNMSDGVYNFKHVYITYGYDGSITRSTPSEAFPVTLSAGGSSQGAVLVVKNPQLLGDASVALRGTYHQIYRTEAGGSTYYLSNESLISYTAATSQITSTLSDADLIGREPLYTSGGEIPNLWPGNVEYITSHRNRVFCTPADDRTAVYYSKSFSEGLGVEFGDGMFIRSVVGGDITGLSTLDDKVLIFKENQIRAFYGDGPNALGQGEFSSEQIVTKEVGCLEGQPIVEYPGGVIFKSAKGFYSLTRDLQEAYIGAPVERYNSHNVICGGADTNSRQIYLLLDDPDHTLLLWDYLLNQWGTWSSFDALDCTMWNNNLVFLGDYGLQVQNPGVFIDETVDSGLNILQSSVLTSLETPWMNISSIQGYQRISDAYMYGEAEAASGLNYEITFSFDGDENSFNTLVFDNESILGTDNQFELKAQAPNQICRSVRIGFEETVSGVLDSSLELLGFSLDILAKSGNKGLSQSRRK